MLYLYTWSGHVLVQTSTILACSIVTVSKLYRVFAELACIMVCKTNDELQAFQELSKLVDKKEDLLPANYSRDIPHPSPI